MGLVFKGVKEINMYLKIDIYSRESRPCVVPYVLCRSWSSLGVYGAQK